MQRNHRIGARSVELHDCAWLKAQALKPGRLGRGIAIAHQLIAHLDPDNAHRLFGNSGEIIVKRKIKIALARAHIDDQRLLGLDRGDQRGKYLHHLVDLAELVLRVVADCAVLAGKPERLEPGLAGFGQRPVLGPVVIS